MSRTWLLMTQTHFRHNVNTTQCILSIKSCFFMPELFMLKIVRFLTKYERNTMIYKPLQTILEFLKI